MEGRHGFVRSRRAVERLGRLWRIVARAVERVLRLQGIVGKGQSGAQSDCSAVRSSISNMTQHVAPRAIAAVAPIRIVLGVLDELGFSAHRAVPQTPADGPSKGAAASAPLSFGGEVSPCSPHCFFMRPADNAHLHPQWTRCETSPAPHPRGYSPRWRKHRDTTLCSHRSCRRPRHSHEECTSESAS